ncbi:SDR family oxidoreductase [Oceanicoccus sp. KOV_DT_Chl]|uniref:SDR family NAD(P)-dependent oxidoreductase n=1 Tax=Oceanicoccus sp. KOV_DT_Chl TaxID=1904639 RepID=UPI000C7AF395|nr:SDR family oxidoreductase [Oceanicoccus sp. KOV_DT_Chl]
MSNVVITGSSKGIGFGLAREFALRGHNVVIAGRSQQSVDDAITRITKLPGTIIGLPCDVAEKEQVQALWDIATKTFGSVDIWINNAGLACTTEKIIDYSNDDVQAMVKTNVLGTINGCQVAGSGMLQQGSKGGKIFNMLGGGSDGQYFPGMGIYGTTKRGLNYLTNAMVKEFKDSNVIIGGIRPGIVITEAVIREAQQDLENFQKQRKIMNILADKVETVAPFLVDGILAFNKPGKEIAWLSGSKIGMRMMFSRFSKQQDKFEEYGL